MDEAQVKKIDEIHQAIVGNPLLGIPGLRKEVTDNNQRIAVLEDQTDQNTEDIRKIKTNVGFRWVERILIAGGSTAAGAKAGAIKTFLIGLVKIAGSILGIS